MEIHNFFLSYFQKTISFSSGPVVVYLPTRYKDLDSTLNSRFRPCESGYPNDCCHKLSQTFSILEVFP